ncbi:MarR family transcriptional regulator [Pseudodesulfovibrio sp.]|nr:MarR family transcriptional regulator [Pseudodesulfovibrio sp.]
MVDQLLCCIYNFPMVLERLKPRESLGFLAWKVSRIVTNDLAARFAAAGVEVTVEQWRALVPLIKLDGLSQGKLCELLSQEKTGVSRLVAALEKRGLVRREACKTDRRVKHIYITDAGRELVESTVDMAVASRDMPLKGLDPAEVEICKRVLWQIIEPTLGDYCVVEEWGDE